MNSASNVNYVAQSNSSFGLIPGLPDEVGAKILSYLPAIEIPRYLEARGKSWWNNRLEVYINVFIRKESLNKMDLQKFQRLFSLQLRPEGSEVSATPIKSVAEIFKEIDYNLNNLKHLDLSCCSSLTDEDLIAILEHSPNLTTINLPCTPITDASLEALSKCHHLTSINLQGSSRITNKGVKALAQSCPNLQSLTLYSRSISDDGIKAVIESCPKLQSLSLMDCSLTPNLFYRFNSQCPSLLKLELHNCEIDDITMAEFIARCPNLEALNVSYQKKIGDRSMQALADYCPKVETIEAQSCEQITDVSLKAFEQLKQLTSINLVACNGPTREKVKAFRKAHHPHILLLK